jgi:hypothetical protein
MKIATYNVNGITARLPVLLRWLQETTPDVACLQELKAPQEKFPPFDEIRGRTSKSSGAERYIRWLSLPVVELAETTDKKVGTEWRYCRARIIYRKFGEHFPVMMKIPTADISKQSLKALRPLRQAPLRQAQGAQGREL